MKTGLVLGKFAPLHRGHQRLIETALGEIDHLIALVYDAPETTTVPLPVRSGWIRKLYPAIEVIEAWDGPTTVGETPEIKAMHEQYILRILQGRRIDVFFSGEFYGEHVSRALGAIDRRLDREALPVSGTQIRREPFACRGFLHPIVYSSLVARIVLLGAPSTGKTTLASQLAQRFSTTWMPEYGREYWEAHQQDRRLTTNQLIDIAEEHRSREDQLATQANRFLFVDTDATTTALFSQYYHGTIPPRLRELADACRSRYDLFFLCEDDIPYDHTWDRSGEANRTLFQKQTKADLTIRRTPFISLNGPIATRIARVESILTHFEKYKPLPDVLTPHVPNPAP